MDSINNQGHKQVFPRGRQNLERAYTTDKTKSHIKKRKHTGPPTSIRGKKHQYNHQKSLQHICEVN